MNLYLTNRIPPKHGFKGKILPLGVLHKDGKVFSVLSF